VKVAIFGAGSIGGYIGGRLTQSGADVLLVDAWSEHVNVMRSQGLQLSNEHGTDVVKVQCRHINELHEQQIQKIDLAILCVKSYESTWMTHLIKSFLHPNALVLSMQNGMNDQEISAVVGSNRVLGCTLTRLGTELVSPGHIHRWLEAPNEEYPVFRVGELHGRISKRVCAVVELLSKINKAIPTRNISGERWSKLTQNAMVSAISPLTNQSIKELFTSPRMLQIMTRLVSESILVGEGLGYSLEKICGIEPSVWKDQAKSFSGDKFDEGIRLWMRNMGDGGQPSTLLDIRSGRRTEIDAINGLIARQAKEVGVPAPMHAFLCEKVHQREIEGDRYQALSEDALASYLMTA
jgi:2-dehydropantoate 2-reductase